MKFVPTLALILATRLFAGEDADFQKYLGLYTLQEYQLAAEGFQKFIDAYPKSERLEDARLRLADSFYLMKNYPEAAKRFTAFLNAHPNSPRRPDALLRAAKCFSAIKDFETCLKHSAAFIDENRAKVQNASQQDPILVKMATALYHAGDCANELKDTAKAQTYWEECLKTQPNSKLVPDVSEGLASIYYDKKLFDKAAATFRVAADWTDVPDKNRPDDVRHYHRAAVAKFMEGRALGELKEYDKALAAIKLSTTLTGSSPALEAEAALRTAELSLQAKRYPDALAAYRRLAKEFATFPPTPDALSAAIVPLYDAKQFAEAAELATQYLELTKAAPNAAKRSAIGRVLARSLTELKKPAEAAEAARAALKDAETAQTERAPSLMLLAELDPKEAPKLYAEIKERHADTPFAVVAQYNLTRFASEAGKFEEALKLAEETLAAIEKAPANQPGIADLKRDALFAAGYCAFQKPDFKKAAEHLRAYLKEYGDKDARADDAASRLAISLRELGDDTGAIAAADAARAAHPKSQNLGDLLYVRALALNRTGNADEALKSYESLLTDAPDSPNANDALFDMAAILYAKKKYPEAQTKLDALFAKPTLAPALKTKALQLRAHASFQNQKFADAVADAETLLKGTTDAKLNLVALRLIRALSLLSIPGKESEALPALNELIDKGPTDAPEIRIGRERRAGVLFDAKKFADAKADFIFLSDPAKSATPQQAADAALRLALIHMELKETKEAKALFEKLAEQKLEGTVAYDVPNLLGNMLLEASDHGAAAKNYERAIAAAKDRKDIKLESISATRLNLGRALLAAKEKDKAGEAFAELIKADPDGKYTAEALFERGRLLAEASKTAEAVAAWQEIQTKFAASPVAEKSLFLIGQAQAQMGKFAEAAESFEKHAEKFPEANARETQCGLAESRLHLNDLEKARAAFNKVLGPKAIEADLDDPTERAFLGLAEISLKAGDPAAAKKYVLRIILENPQSTWLDAACLIAGQASEAIKEPEKAIGYYRKLLTDRPQSPHKTIAEDRLKALGAPK